jgi:FAD/FMN-containing dehydrogenase
MALAEELEKIVHGEVDDSPQALADASHDASLYTVRPEIVVSPQDAGDVEAVVAFVADKKKANPQAQVSITARSAGTDMSGGPLNNSIILSMTPHLNHLLRIGKDFAVVEPGMFFRDFDQETKTKNLELPSYTASRDINTVGGMVANDSGGEKNLKYGKTARYVQELDVVLADGKVHTLKSLEGEALADKLREQSYEGDIYRGMAKVVSDPENRKIITDATPNVGKNSSGYALWDIGDGTNTLNLARLMVGAQGTLGIITRIQFGLVQPKPYSSMVVMFLDSLSDLSVVVPEVLQHKPDSFESYDDHTFQLALHYFPEFAKRLGGGAVAMGIAFLPEMMMFFTGGIPKLILMAEFRADTQEECLGRAESLIADIKHKRPKERMRLARNAQESAKYWAIRHESFNLLRQKVHGKRTAPFIDDFVVPPETLTEFLPKLEEVLAGHDLIYTVAGHMGDGNFHIIPLIDPKRPDLEALIAELSHTVYDLVLAHGGSISGEHNDGIVRTPYVEKMFGPEMTKLFAEVKALFDPLGIFNPGKKVATPTSGALAQLDVPKQ